MRTTTRFALAIATVVLTLAPATAALAGDGNQAPITNEVATDLMAPTAGKTLSPGMTLDPQVELANGGGQVDAGNAPQIDPGVLSPQGNGQVSAENLADVDLGVASPNDEADDNGQVSAENLADIEILFPKDEGDDTGQVSAEDLADIDVGVVFPNDEADDGGALEIVPQDPSIPDWLQDMIDEAVADALDEQGPAGEVTVDVTELATDEAAYDTAAGFEPWMYGAFGAAAVLVIWMLLAIGGHIAARRS